MADHCDVWRLPGANVFKLLVIFRDTTNWPQCQKPLAGMAGSKNRGCKFRKCCSTLENVPQSHLQICRVAGILGKLNCPVACILWYMKKFKKHGRANRKPVGWIKVNHSPQSPPVTAKLESHAMRRFLLILLGKRSVKPLAITGVTLVASAFVRVSRYAETDAEFVCVSPLAPTLPPGGGLKNKVCTANGPCQNTTESWAYVLSNKG